MIYTNSLIQQQAELYREQRLREAQHHREIQHARTIQRGGDRSPWARLLVTRLLTMAASILIPDTRCRGVCLVIGE